MYVHAAAVAGKHDEAAVVAFRYVAAEAVDVFLFGVFVVTKNIQKYPKITKLS